MADVTISGLSEGVPNKSSAIIPYSDGSTTYKTSPSGIVAASPGCILQVVFGTSSTQVIHTATYADVISLAMTIKGINSKVLININQHVNTGQDTGYGFRMLRDSTVIHAVAAANSYGAQVVGGTVNVGLQNFINFQYLDTGVLTQNQAYTYKGQANKPVGPQDCISNYNAYGAKTSTITLMEIAG